MKIIATLGPSSMKKEVLKALLDAGVDSIRLNFSHFHEEEFRKVVTEVRKSKRKVEIMGDLSGRKIRISEKVASTYKIYKDDIVYFCGEDMYDYLINDKTILKVMIPLNIKGYMIDNNNIKKISMKDDTMNFEILDQDHGIIKAKVKNDGIIRAGKGCNIPSLSLTKDKLREADKKNIIWALDNDFDALCQSYVESENDILLLKEFTEKNNKNKKNILYYGKIETEKGINNIEKISDNINGIIIARGDLMPECGIKDAVRNQYIAISKLKAKGIEDKIIIATHLLDSMIKNDKAQYTEVESLYGFIKNGITGFLLAGEVSIGKYPLESFLLIKNLIRYYSSDFLYK